MEIVQFPALIEFEDGTLGWRLETTSTSAEVATRNGIRRLYQMLNKKSLRSQVRWLPRWDEVCLWSSTLFPKNVLEDQLSLLLAELAFLQTGGTPRRQQDFESRQQEAVARISSATQIVATVVPNMMEAFHEAQLALSNVASKRFAWTRDDIEAQLSRMMHDSFLSDTPWTWLSQFPRYLAAIKLRIDRLGTTSPSAEAACIRELDEFWSRIEGCDENSNFLDRDALIEYRWMLEEYRVSLFAQQLGTLVKVSPQRLDKQWAKTQR